LVKGGRDDPEPSELHRGRAGTLLRRVCDFVADGFACLPEQHLG
jgi:hypothetical protein